MCSIELPYERAAMRGEPLPDRLTGLDMIIYYALCNVYDRYHRGEFDRQKGSYIKNRIINERDSINQYICKNAEMWKQIEKTASEYSLRPSIETADKFYAAVYNLPDDWRLKR